MSAILFLTLIIAIPIAVYPDLKGKHGSVIWIIPISTSIVGILGYIGTYRSCASGWFSQSIEKQETCSYYGGVTTNINNAGLVILSLSSIFLIYKLIKFTFISRATIKKKKNLNKINSDQDENKKHYSKFIVSWHSNGLSADEIIEHLSTKNVAISHSEIEEAINRSKQNKIA